MLILSHVSKHDLQARSAMICAVQEFYVIATL
jgi:hypothetical protein